MQHVHPTTFNVQHSSHVLFICMCSNYALKPFFMYCTLLTYKIFKTFPGEETSRAPVAACAAPLIKNVLWALIYFDTSFLVAQVFFDSFFPHWQDAECMLLNISFDYFSTNCPASLLRQWAVTSLYTAVQYHYYYYYNYNCLFCSHRQHLMTTETQHLTVLFDAGLV